MVACRVAPVLAAFAAAAAIPGRAFAADEAEPVRLAYAAPPSCPDAEAFVKEVRARTTRFQIVDSGTDLRSFEVRIAAAATGFTGTVHVVDGKGAVSTRTVDGARCEDVTRTLAFVTAISIDPRALSAPGQPPADPAATQADATPPANVLAQAPAPAAQAPAPPVAQTTSKPPEARPTIAAAAPQEALAQQNASPPREWHIVAGVGAFAASLSAPGPVIGEGAFVGLSFDTQRLWSPELRIGAAQASSGTLNADPGQVSLSWIVARADACPMRWPPLGRLSLRPCVTADVGALSATPNGVPHPQSAVRPWATLGALALAEWEPWGPLLVDAEVSLSAPLQRDQFYIAPEPTPTLYQAPALVPAGALALGARFP